MEWYGGYLKIIEYCLELQRGQEVNRKKKKYSVIIRNIGAAIKRKWYRWA